MEICLVDVSRRKKLIIDLKHKPSKGEFVRLEDRCFQVEAVFHDVDARYSPTVVIREVDRNMHSNHEWVQYASGFNELGFILKEPLR